MSNIPPPNRNFRAKTIWTGDNLYIMRGMNSATVDLIYLDPPFNSKANYAAPIGSAAAGAAFKDTWTLNDLDVEWLDVIEKSHPNLWRVLMAAMKDSDKSYLIYMAIRLLEMKRLLKPTGSIYLHCDPTMSHYLKLVMDAVFGHENFRNEIVWCYTGPGSPKMKQFNRKHDIIFWYACGEKWTFNRDDVRVPYKDPNQRPRRAYDTGGSFEPSSIDTMRRRGKVPETWWQHRIVARSKKENTGYPTQKPLFILQRIIQASSNKGDLVLDPFCGCATTCVAAHNFGRGWVGIDISEKAADLVVERISEAQGSLYEDIIHRKDVPQRTDLGPLPKYNSKENKENLYGKQKGNCASCNEHFKDHHLEVDHIIAKSKGGTDHIENLQLLCGHCNRVKGNRGMAYLRERLRLAA